nr:hypothetical protein [Pandoravirus aubagnensis]
MSVLPFFLTVFVSLSHTRAKEPGVASQKHTPNLLDQPRPSIFPFFFWRMGEKELLDTTTFWGGKKGARGACHFCNAGHTTTPGSNHTYYTTKKDAKRQRTHFAPIALGPRKDCNNAATKAARAHNGRRSQRARLSWKRSLEKKESGNAMAMHGGGVPPDPRDNSRAGVLVHGQFVCVRCAGPLLAVGFWPLSVRFVGHSESDGGGMLLHGGAHCVVCGTQRQIVENARHNAVCAIPSDDTGPTTSGSSPQEAPPQEEAPPPRRSICLLM